MKRLAYILTAVLALASCAKEQFEHPTEAQAPQTASAYEPVITVDQEINQVTFSIDAKAVIPVWIFQDKDGEFTERKAQNGLKRIFATAGDYKVRMQVMNSAGVSPDYVEKTFHIENTIASFDRYITFLAGGTAADNTKNWHINGEVEAHLGCGESGTEGTNWWSAAPGDKEAFGVYGDILTFGGDGAYTYNPGDDGATYVNIDGVTVAPFTDQKGDASADYNVTVEAQTTTYTFTYQGNDLYLTFPEHTLFPYIDNDDFWAKPEFKVLSITREDMELVHDNGSIAWHFLLTSKAAAYVFKGFNYNADSNLWKPADAAHTYSYYYAPGWAQIDNPETVQEGAEYTVTLPAATSDQWQAQFFIIPDEPVVVSADKNYDFSVIVNTNKELPGMTLKLTSVDSDDVFLFANREKFEAGETIYYLSDLTGVDAPNGVKMVFDFGGNAEGTVVSVANIVLKDHAIDDGTILPGEEPVVQPGGYLYGDNLFGGLYLKETWFSPADWAGGLDPQARFEGGVLTLTTPEGIGGAEWQGQVKLVADIPADPEKQYAFFATIESSIGGTVTVKLADANDDSNHAFFYDNGVALEGFAPLAYKNEPVAPDQAYEAVMAIFDFGRIPAGAEVKVSGIELREITGEVPGGSDAVTFDYNSEKNLWKPADASHTYSQFYAPDWQEIAKPDITNEGSSYSFSCPEATSLQWQNQFFIIPSTDIVLDPEKTYDFQCKVELSQSVEQVTFKLAGVVDDGNFVFTERRDIEAYDEFVFELVGVNQEYKTAEAVKMVFDFGGNPAGLDVVIKDIILYEHEGAAPVTPGEPGDSREPGSEEAYYDIAGATNLWQADTDPAVSFWFANGNWDQIADPDHEILAGNGISLTIPEATGGALWQGQVKILTNIPAANANEYDFSADIVSSAAGTVAVKLTGEEDDADHDLFYMENFDIVEGSTAVRKPYLFPKADVGRLQLILDFGRVPVGTEISVTNICFQKHIPASQAPEDEGGPNLWASASVTPSYWFSAADWAGGLEPQVIFPLDGNGIIVVVPQGVGGSEWQGQVALQSDIPVSSAKLYNFSSRIATTSEGVCTVKLSTAADADPVNEFFYDNNVVLSPSAPLLYAQKKVTNTSAEAGNAKLIFDFGRMPAGTVITITDIALREHGDNPDYQDPAAGGETWFDVEGDTNLWRSANVTVAEVWFADGSWNPLASQPEVTLGANNGISITLPEGFGPSQWQGQIKLDTDIAVSPDKTYDCCFTVVAAAAGNITAKLTNLTDNNDLYFWNANIGISAGETVVTIDNLTPGDAYNLKFILDLGTAPDLAGTDFAVKDICFQQHKEKN